MILKTPGSSAISLSGNGFSLFCRLAFAANRGQNGAISPQQHKWETECHEAGTCSSSDPFHHICGRLPEQRSVARRLQIAAAPARSPVEGQWQGTDGVAVSTFTAGKFTSNSASTGELLTEGTYTEAPSGLIQLSFYSLRSQKNVAANCLIAEGQRLNCTLDSGTQFVLVRKAGV